MKGNGRIMDITPLKLSVTNCFLVKARDHYVLIDTGYEDDWDLFCARLKEADVGLFQINHVILTHHHDDHCGLLNNILRENNSIKVVMSHRCKDPLSEGKNDLTNVCLLNKRIAFLMRGGRLYLSLLFKKVVAKEEMDTFPPYQLRNHDILVTGDTGLREIGIPLDGKIIEMPGHTIDSVSILFDDGDCLIGDAAANVNFLQFLGAKYCADLITDMDAFYESWEKVMRLGAHWIYPGHGIPFVVDKLKANLGKNEAKNLVPYHPK
jgi:glyoxylase-like metal-dependent hydrolase (beta-lactamase superfamily II)